MVKTYFSKMPDQADIKRWPGYSDEAHPEVFTRIPLQPKEKKPGQISEGQLKQYFEKGYVVINDFFTKEELDPCKDAIDVMVDELANKLYNAGKIKNLYKDHGHSTRLTMIEKEFPGANIILHKTGKLPPAFRNLWANENILNLVEQIIGPDIGASPVWNLRTKTPKNAATVVPWHQDSAYFDKDAYKQIIPTAWIPLLDATEENGCLQVVENGHKTGKVATHQCCAGPTWYVMLEDEEMKRTLEVDPSKETVTCPVKYGGFVFFSNMIPHASLPNVSKDIRWSLDLRWQRPDQPYGLWGLKDGIPLRLASNPDLKPDWETFVSVDRTTQQAKHTTGEPMDEFDTTITGPWMKQWELVHHNVHTDAMGDEDKQTVMDLRG